jgi:hypothetical protein
VEQAAKEAPPVDITALKAEAQDILDSILSAPHFSKARIGKQLVAERTPQLEDRLSAGLANDIPECLLDSLHAKAEHARPPQRHGVLFDQEGVLTHQERLHHLLDRQWAAKSVAPPAVSGARAVTRDALISRHLVKIDERLRLPSLRSPAGPEDLRVWKLDIGAADIRDFH